MKKLLFGLLFLTGAVCFAAMGTINNNTGSVVIGEVDAVGPADIDEAASGGPLRLGAEYEVLGSLSTVDTAGDIQGLKSTNAGVLLMNQSDGTNVMPTMDAVARAGYCSITDGTNTLPTMDAQARPGFVTLTDGASEVDVIGTINSVKTDLSSVAGIVTSTSSGNKDTGTQRVAIATDDINMAAIKTAVEIIDNPVAVLGTATYTEATTSGGIIGAVRNDTLATLANTDNEVAPLQVNEDGALYVKDVGGASVLPATHRGGVAQDFAVAFTSNVTVTCSGAPFTVDDANGFISYIYYRPTGGSWQAPIINGISGASITSATNVITIAGAGTPFAASDEYLVGIVYQEKGYDSSLDVKKVVEQAPLWARYTSLESYTTFAADDATFDEGTVIDVQGYNTLNLYYSKSASDADNSYLKVVCLESAASAVDYQEVSIGSPAGGVTVITQNVYERDKAALVEMLSIPTLGCPFIRLDQAKVTDTGTDSTFTTKISKSYL